MNLERRSGEHNGNAKLTYRKAENVRRLYASGKCQGWIAAKYDVSRACISHVIARRSYASPPDQEFGGRYLNRRRGHK